MTTLVTGATGFVGRAVVAEMRARGLPVRAAVRVGREGELTGAVGVTDPTSAAAWEPALAGAASVIHLLGRAHTTREAGGEFQRVNVDVTAALAEAARRAGIARFVHVSTSKVVETDADDPYTSSKRAGERAVADALDAGRLVIVRPPLVYGPGVRANFRALLRWVASGVPVPLGAVENRRSLIYLGNLVDALLWLARPDGPSGTFFVADDEVVGTPQLVRQMAAALGRPARLFPVPVVLLRAAGAAIGRRGVIERLVGSMVVDDAPIRRLGWRPPYNRTQALLATASRWRST